MFVFLYLKLGTFFCTLAHFCNQMHSLTCVVVALRGCPEHFAKAKCLTYKATNFAMCRTSGVVTSRVESGITWPLCLLLFGSLFAGCTIMFMHVNIIFTCMKYMQVSRFLVVCMQCKTPTSSWKIIFICPLANDIVLIIPGTKIIF